MMTTQTFRTGPRRLVAAGAFALLGALAAGCTSAPGPVPSPGGTFTGPAEATRVAVAHVLLVDHTFCCPSPGSTPFDHVVVTKAYFQGTPLEEATRAALDRGLDHITDVVVEPGRTSGTVDAVISVGQPQQRAGGVLSIQVSMTCGNVCGWYATYLVAPSPTLGWLVVGTEGMPAIA